MNSAIQSANQTISNDIHLDFENVEPKIEQVFVHGTSDISGYCNEIPKIKSDISSTEPLKDEKTIYEGRFDGEPYRKTFFTKDKMKLENSVLEQDTLIMTTEATKNTLIKEEPNLVIDSDTGIYDGKNSICHDSQAFIKAEWNISSFEKNEQIHYLKVEEIATEEIDAVKNEAVESKQ